MSDRIEFVPEGFFQDLFSYFGTQSSSFILFSGVAISGLGLTDYINPTIWLTAAVAAMICSYSLRHYVTARYLLVIAISAMVTLIGVTLVVAYADTIAVFIAGLNSTRYGLMSLFSFFAVSTIFCTNYISYRKFQLSIISEIPEAIHKSILLNVYDNKLYYSNFAYRVEISSSTAGNITVDTMISMVVQNRAGTTEMFSSRYPAPTGAILLRSLRVNSVAKDLDDPALRSGDGIRSMDVVPAKGSLSIDVHITEKFPNKYNEIFTAYALPAEAFSIEVTNHVADTIKIWLEPLHSESAIPVRSGKSLTWTSSGAILPNQGVRLFWSRRGKDETR